MEKPALASSGLDCIKCVLQKDKEQQHGAQTNRPPGEALSGSPGPGPPEQEASWSLRPDPGSAWW